MITDNNFFFKIISVLRLSWQKNTAYAKPRPYHALSLRLKGDATFTHGDKKYVARKNDIIYVPKDYEYTITSEKSETVLVIHFDIIGERKNSIETFTPINPEIFIDLFTRMEEAWYKKSVGYKYRMDSLFSRILENMEIQQFKAAGSVKGDFAELLDYLHSNFTDPLVTVETLSSRMNITPTYLRLLFHEKLGVSPHKYVTALRMDYATSLLESGYYTVEEVAEMSGYNDPKYFSTCYKKYKGLSPIKIKNGWNGL